jgi:hypothetical protein
MHNKIGEKNMNKKDKLKSYTNELLDILDIQHNEILAQDKKVKKLQKELRIIQAKLIELRCEI